MLYFKSYYYVFIKQYFHLFVSKIKNLKKYTKIRLNKNYIKNIKKRNIKENSIRNIKLSQFSLSNYNKNKNQNELENSYNNKKNQSEKDFSNPNKINYFLINNNKINFSAKAGSKKRELYRNNLELLKKYSKIKERKKRKKLFNEFINEDCLKSNKNTEFKTIDISLYDNNTNLANNKSFERGYNNKIYSPHSINCKNIILIKEDNLQSITNNINKINSLSIRTKKEIKLKENMIKNKFKENIYRTTGNSPISLKNDGIKYFNRNNDNYINKKKNQNNYNNLVASKKEKINNINNSHYAKHYICRNIKNIFTRDKKLNIHINYVFFIPPKKSENKFKKINTDLKISYIYSYFFLGNNQFFDQNNRIISSKKLPLIKEEEI